ncbi:hypothetical protein [Streptomyces sp. KL116D]|uniref:hypothetical protein n=1 Tax=Streptomyces sp. KL116D TaxID=3045152 RepID=UPI0035580D88
MLLAGDAAHIHFPAGGQGAEHGRAGRGQPGLEARLRGARPGAGRACWTAITPSATRSRSGCCTTPGRSRRWPGQDRRRTRCARCSASCWCSTT